MPVTFPDQLTKPALVKNKKLLDGLGLPTLAAHIGELEAMFDSSYFVKADPVKLGQETAEPVKFERNRDGFKKVLETQRTKLKKKADDIDATLRKIMKEVEANKKADKKVKVYGASLAKSMHGFAVALQPVATNEMIYLIEKSFKAHLVADVTRKQSIGMVEMVADDGPGWRKKLLEEIQKVKGQGTVDAVHEMWKSGSSTARNFYIQLSAGWDQALFKCWPELAGQSPFSGKALEHYAKLPWVADVANEAQSKASDQLRAALGGSEDERHVVTTMLAEYRDSVEEMYLLYPRFPAAWRELSKWK